MTFDELKREDALAPLSATRYTLDDSDSPSKHQLVSWKWSKMIEIINDVGTNIHHLQDKVQLLQIKDSQLGIQTFLRRCSKCVGSIPPPMSTGKSALWFVAGLSLGMNKYPTYGRGKIIFTSYNLKGIWYVSSREGTPILVCDDFVSQNLAKPPAIKHTGLELKRIRNWIYQDKRLKFKTLWSFFFEC